MSVQMSAKDAHEFNMVEVIKYRTEHPEVFWCPEIVDLIGAYLDHNGLKVVTASMIHSVVSRLGNVGLLPERDRQSPSLIGLKSSRSRNSRESVRSISA